MKGEKAAMKIFELVKKDKMLPSKIEELVPLSFIGQVKDGGIPLRSPTGNFSGGTGPSPFANMVVNYRHHVRLMHPEEHKRISGEARRFENKLISLDDDDKKNVA